MRRGARRTVAPGNEKGAGLTTRAFLVGLLIQT